MAVVQAITVYRGSDVSLNFTMTPVVNLTGWTIAFTLTKKPNMLTKLITQPAVVDPGAGGTFTVALTDAQLDLAPGTYAFDVWRTDPGQEQPLAVGQFIILGNSRVPPIG